MDFSLARVDNFPVVEYFIKYLVMAFNTETVGSLQLILIPNVQQCTPRLYIYFRSIDITLVKSNCRLPVI